MSDYTQALQGLANTSRQVAQPVQQGFDFNPGSQQQPKSWQDYYGSYKGEYGGSPQGGQGNSGNTQGQSQYGGPQLQFLMNAQKREWEDALGKQQSQYDQTLKGYMDQINSLQSNKDEFSNWMTQYQQQQDQRNQERRERFQGMLGQQQPTQPTQPTQPQPTQPSQPSQQIPLSFVNSVVNSLGLQSNGITNQLIAAELNRDGGYNSGNYGQLPILIQKGYRDAVLDDRALGVIDQFMGRYGYR